LTIEDFMRFQNVGSRFNLIIIVLVLVLVLEIRILWVPKDEYEYEDEDDEVLALYACMELHENYIGFW